MTVPDSVARRLVELACLAPSVHNTQPWSWQVHGGRIRLYADRSRQLPVEDPLGRNLTISCGAALHHLRYALRALGWLATVDSLPNGHGSDLLAEVRLTRGRPSALAADELAVLRRRCTDRRRFTTWPVADDRLEELAAEARSHRAHAQAIIDPVERLRIELLANRAAAIQSADPASVREQHEWIDRHNNDGVPLAVLPAEVDRLVVTSRFGPGLLEDVQRVVEGSDRVIVLGGRTDDTAAWLRTGEALSALWLRATEDGLSVVPLSQPTEVRATQEDIRESVLHGRFIPHLLVRIGWQAIGRSELPRTPRRPVASMIQP